MKTLRITGPLMFGIMLGLASASCSSKSLDLDMGSDVGTMTTPDFGEDAGTAPQDVGQDAGQDVGSDLGSSLDAGPNDQGPMPCVENLELIVHRVGTYANRVFAKVRKDGEEVALLVDTGSQLTFLSAPGQPDGAPNVGAIDFGCGPRSLLGRPFSAAEEADLAGLPVVGFLGADFFFETLTRLDLSAARITRIDRSQISPDAFTLAYEDVFGFLFVDVIFDGVPLKLGFDTGAPHALWIGVEGQPGDEPRQTQDGYGNPLILYQGTTELSLGAGPTRTIPVLRTPTFPSIEDGNDQLGIIAHGLFGLTSVPGTSFVIDAENSVLWLE